MIVRCDKCKVVYDDTYHDTICPHKYFEICTHIVNGAGESKICTSIEELNKFLSIPKDKASS